MKYWNGHAEPKRATRKHNIVKSPGECTKCVDETRRNYWNLGFLRILRSRGLYHSPEQCPPNADAPAIYEGVICTSSYDLEAGRICLFTQKGIHLERVVSYKLWCFGDLHTQDVQLLACHICNQAKLEPTVWAGWWRSLRGENVALQP